MSCGDGMGRADTVSGEVEGPVERADLGGEPACWAHLFGDETGGDETGGDETGGDETGGDDIGGDETGGDETGRDESVEDVSARRR